jgi:threonine/homoserine/homoserine lactone efflux protein
MIESLITISIVGLVAGFIFSIPVAGPISILITSKSLNGDHRYCTFAAIGASIVDFLYCFIAVYSFTRLYELYRPIINYIFLFGSGFLFFIGVKILRTKLSLNAIQKSGDDPSTMKKKGGFWTGFMVNFLNPSLFIGWLLSSFLIMSVASDLGFNTGGLKNVIDNNIKAMNHIDTKHNNSDKNTNLPVIRKSDQSTEKNLIGFYQAKKSSIFPILISFCYAFFVAFGTIIWFYYFSMIIVKHRRKLKVPTINKIIQALGIALCFFGLFLAYKAFDALII